MFSSLCKATSCLQLSEHEQLSLRVSCDDVMDRVIGCPASCGMLTGLDGASFVWATFSRPVPVSPREGCSDTKVATELRLCLPPLPLARRHRTLVDQYSGVMAHWYLGGLLWRSQTALPWLPSRPRRRRTQEHSAFDGAEWVNSTQVGSIWSAHFPSVSLTW